MKHDYSKCGTFDVFGNARCAACAFIVQAENKLNRIRNEYLRTIPQSENDLRQTFLWWRDQAIALQAEIDEAEKKS